MSSPTPDADATNGGDGSEAAREEAPAGVARRDDSEVRGYLRSRDFAPGVAEGGAERNHYCMSCQGVIPLRYDSRKPRDSKQKRHCPHCGVELDERVQAMFNWVETDSVPGSDMKAVLPWLLGGLALVTLLALGGLILVFG